MHMHIAKAGKNKILIHRIGNTPPKKRGNGRNKSITAAADEFIILGSGQHFNSPFQFSSKKCSKSRFVKLLLVGGKWVFLTKVDLQRLTD
jgi:hypothetical protein